MASITLVGSGLPVSRATSRPALWTSHSIVTFAAARIFLVASTTSGPMPSPGMSVMRCPMKRSLTPDHGRVGGQFVPWMDKSLSRQEGPRYRTGRRVLVCAPYPPVESSSMIAPRFLPLLLVPFFAAIVPGCGHSEEEWQAQLDKYNRLQSEQQATQAKLDDV